MHLVVSSSHSSHVESHSIHFPSISTLIFGGQASVQSLWKKNLLSLSGSHEVHVLLVFSQVMQLSLHAMH